MRLVNVHPNDQSEAIQALVHEVERLRMAQREAWRKEEHPALKRFTQEELRDLACPSYYHLLSGNTKRLPSRAMVLQIAEYLECSIHECNKLLLAAEYLPEIADLSDDAYAAALERGHRILNELPLPAIIVGRGWKFEAANCLFQQIHSMGSSMQMPNTQHSALQYMFDPAMPFLRVIGQDPAVWHANIAYLLPALRGSPMLHREPAYRQALSEARQLPEFNKFWATDDDTLRQQYKATTLTVNTPVSAFTNVHLASINLAPAPAPQLVVGIPGNAAAFHSLAMLGAPVLENRWEQVIPAP